MKHFQREHLQFSGRTLQVNVVAALMLVAAMFVVGRGPLVADLIGNSVQSDGDGSFYTINVDTGAATSVGNSGLDIEGIAFNPTSGVLFGLNTSSDDLVTIDPSNGNVTDIGDTGINFDDSGLAFDGSGNLFAVVGNTVSQTTSDLYSIDTGTGNATLLGSTNINGNTIDSISFLGSTLYGLSPISDSLYSISTSTGAASLVKAVSSSFFGSGANTGLGTTSTGELFGISDVTGQILQINPSGTDTLASTTSDGFESLAFTPAAVPEPSSMVLLGLVGMAGVGWRQRKRRKLASV